MFPNKKQKRIHIKNELDLPDTTEEIIINNTNMKVKTIHLPFTIIPEKI
jgi:hypothetical protein